MPEQSSASAADSCSLHAFDELLSLDDIFVEYFNEFLQSGIFVQKIEYHRQLNTFVEKNNDSSLISGEEFAVIDDDRRRNDVDSRSVYSGFSDFIQLDEIPERTEKNAARLQKHRQVQMMEWAKAERLGLFWRTELYRQYKLCKLLLRPLTIEKEGSEYSSQGVAGYSRQSVYTAARTLSTDNSNGNGPATVDEDDEQQQQTDNDQVDPWSNANMIFENNLLAAEYLRMPRAFLRPGSRAYSVPVNMASSLSIFFPPVQSKPMKKGSKRSTSSKTSQRKSLPKEDDQPSISDPNDPRSLSMFSSAKIRYFEDGEYDEETDDVTGLGLQMQGSSSQLKYKYLGCFKGMQAFVRFLQTTKGGYDLYRFWMDCEFFKDTMAGLDQIENVVARTRLFRDLNDDKYHLPFMRHLQNKIRRAYSETAGILTHDVFLQVQYDVLRRLRVYWSARFIIHQLFEQHHPQTPWSDQSVRPANVCLYPIDQRAQAHLIEMTRVFLSDDYATNENMISSHKTLEIHDEVEQSFNNPIMRKYATVIRQDKQGGGLFLRYVTYSERRLLPLMLFCYDVDDFRYSNLDDKVLESQHGLSILNTYFRNSAKLSLDPFMPDIQIERWLETFQHYRFDKLTFEPLFKRALLILKDAWLRCLKEDVDRFTSAYYLTGSHSAATKSSGSKTHAPKEIRDGGDEEDEEEADEDDEEEQAEQDRVQPLPVARRSLPRVHSPETQINISNNVIYIKRPWLMRFISSATSDRQDRFLEALENAMTDDERQRLRAERRERLRRLEENRKKAMKAARERRKRLGKEKEGTDASSDKSAQGRRAEITLYIDRILPNKLGPMQSKDAQRLFSGDWQRYVRASKTPMPNFDQKFNLLVDIGKWMEATGHYEKQLQLDRIRKAYFDPQSKRGVIPMTDEQTELFDANHGRPDAPLLQAIYRDLRLELEEEFIPYCESRIHRFEIETIEEYLSKSVDELTLLFSDLDGDTKTSRDDEDDFGGLFDPDMAALAANKDGTGKVTKKHTAELFQLISDAALGRFNERFYYFYAYLTHWVGEKDSAYLDHDFLFCIDVSRLKEIANEGLLQAKLRYLLETYLESSTTSSAFTCRLDIPSADLQLKTLRTLQKALTTNVNDFGVLEEARTYLVKERLVKYYAGFKAYLFRTNLSKTHPSRLARLQEQWNTYQQQVRNQKSAKSRTRSSASTAKDKNSSKKPATSMSKYPTAPSTPVDLTSMTKTQRLLNERMKTFEKLPANQVNDVPFPSINKTQRPRSATNSKVRPSNHHDGTTGAHDRLHSPKEKSRGAITVQYSLTNGLKLKYSDGKPTIESTTTSTTGVLQQPRGSLAYSMSSTHD